MKIIILLFFPYLSLFLTEGNLIFEDKGITECRAASMADVSQWELSITTVNAFQHEFGPEENHTTVNHELTKTGTFRVVKTKSPDSEIVSWKGAGPASLNIDRESLTIMVNPHGAVVESHHKTTGSGSSDAALHFFISLKDEMYSITMHDAFIEALTVSTQKYLFPDGSLFREDVSEKTERFNLTSTVYDIPLSGECILAGNVEQGIPNNINHRKIEWSLSPVH
ncbi:MAG: hypothetical protein JJU13_18575 [Balneolaceae bacterium]|nr:hypothetical protein [Balneolaceae bacterium]